MRRRPSAALIVACAALFVSLGGVGYAATSLPSNSVGTVQLRNGAVTNSKLSKNSVTYKKILPNTVGKVRANLSQIQERVGGKCATGTAIGTVARDGKVSCNAALPAGLQTTSNTASVNVAGSPTTISSLTLPAGAYQALANPTISVTGSGSAQRITVSCTLTVGSASQTRDASVNTGASTIAQYQSIPLQLQGSASTATVSCSAQANTGALPTTSVTTAIDAVRIVG